MSPVRFWEEPPLSLPFTIARARHGNICNNYSHYRSRLFGFGRSRASRQRRWRRRSFRRRQLIWCFWRHRREPVFKSSNLRSGHDFYDHLADFDGHAGQSWKNRPHGEAPRDTDSRSTYGPLNIIGGDTRWSCSSPSC